MLLVLNPPRFFLGEISHNHKIPKCILSSSLNPQLRIRCCANQNNKPKLKPSILLDMSSSSPPSSSYIQLGEGSESDSGDNNTSKTMWGKLGQRFNPRGIVSSVKVILKEQHLALPHLNVQDIRWIDWKELKKQGFQGIVFDKDNTLTAPYAPSLWPSLAHSLQDCKSVFDGHIALLSNSAGLYQYDPDGSEADALEKLIGIPVIRHGTKKPAGNAKDIEKYFGYDPSLLVMVRKLESFLVRCWYRKGFKPASHHLLSSKHECIRDPN
ncbi:phosphatidylglycerophosphate phosphatase 1, chloroplastic/mitochondrial isoform X2 [Cryptomeria japonica]|uniref:phosphatidylglycerophosphate phosphatase 1, chloroplastic/mitochondrial isoform X2 n=1 Tax=Cryptomeria japonica TaxID=3369 RepID=UPI0025ACFA4D|nr:phosphatidylglycerophosphate phosphatase 1, chloroplastic/mitochondrial isoform X2 [Cryptomeria japonica]